MNIYAQKNRWKILLLLTLLLIVIVSILYSNRLAGKLAKEEQKKVELIADVYRRLNIADENLDLDFMFSIIDSNKTVPLILTDEAGTVMGFKNIDTARARRDPKYVNRQLLQMKEKREPIDIEYSKGSHQYIYYNDSNLLVQLKYFPYIQFSIILLFLAVAYLTFSTSRRAEQNRVWVGMAKETAHQLGTPISALSGWVEHMKLIMKDSEALATIPEIEKDIARLELIAQRFSKIGSTPELTLTNLVTELNRNVEYIKRRASGKVNISVSTPGNQVVQALINPPLFDWVLENLLKNALDAIGGDGTIEVVAQRHGKSVYVDVKDSGKGIPSSKFGQVFKPGYSTKKRGWGLGLSLAKRIIQEYHSGRIFVKESQIGKGTTFRMVLKG